MHYTANDGSIRPAPANRHHGTFKHNTGTTAKLETGRDQAINWPKALTRDHESLVVEIEHDDFEALVQLADQIALVHPHLQQMQQSDQ